MIITRKRFLQVSGISLLAVAGEKLMGAFAGSAQNALPASSRALTASRWAMAIDLAKCAQKDGCTKCIEACHIAHNVPQSVERAHRIEWIWKTSFKSAFPSELNEYQAAPVKAAPLPLLCNHCDNPPCVRVCPTKATWKREDGIVMMDWHRCIGCRYCMAACPYGSRSFNWTDPRSHLAQLNPDFPTRTKGVVEKCSFCDERLAKGELPACVDACPQEAMAFGDVGDANSPVRRLLQSRYAIRRKPELGTKPEVFYIV
jgi:molybdopterin-containing oxidoreductase family iron-sulfur binding subunit